MSTLLGARLREKLSNAWLLKTAAADAFSKARGDIHEAAEIMADMLIGNEGLRVDLCLFYLNEMRSPAGTAEESVRGGLQTSAFGQGASAASHGQVEGDGGRGRNATANALLPPSPSPVEMGGAVRHVPHGQLAVAPSVSPSDAVGAIVEVPSGRTGITPAASPHHDRAGHECDASSRMEGARPVVNPPRRLDAIATGTRGLSLFDTFTVRDLRGERVAIGELTAFEAGKIADTNEREGRILRYLISKAGIPARGGTKLRELVREADLQKAISQNAEACNA